jgi:hypothetical protein
MNDEEMENHHSGRPEFPDEETEILDEKSGSPDEGEWAIGCIFGACHDEVGDLRGGVGDGDGGLRLHWSFLGAIVPESESDLESEIESESVDSLEDSEESEVADSASQSRMGQDTRWCFLQ